MNKFNANDGSNQGGGIRPERESLFAPGQAKRDFKDFGQHLRRERELRNISLEEIAQVTRINKRYLLAIEEGHQENLPAIPFVKGFIAAYAKHIGLNSEEEITYYDEVRSEPLQESRTFTPPQAPAKPRNRVWLWVLPAALVLTAALLLWINRRVAAPPERVAVQEEAVQETPAPEVPPPPVKSAPREPEETVSTRPGEGVRLALSAAEKSWVYAVIDEKTVKDFFLQPGEKMEFTAQEVVNLTLGNSGGIMITFNGKDLGALGKHNEVKRDMLFTWDPVKGPELKDTFSRLEETGN